MKAAKIADAVKTVRLRTVNSPTEASGALFSALPLISIRMRQISHTRDPPSSLGCLTRSQEPREELRPPGARRRGRDRE